MINYLAIGTVTEDVWKDGITPGGTVMYSSRTAKSFVENVAVLTPAAVRFDMKTTFPDINVHRIPSPNTTQFENIYEMVQVKGEMRSMRRQVVRPSPIYITARHITQKLQNSAVVHLAPLCNEISADVMALFSADTFIGCTPQGWLRRWDERGHVTQEASNWTEAEAFFRRCNAVVLSIEDIMGDWSVVEEWRKRAHLMVVTVGADGCYAYINGVQHHVQTTKVMEVDPTGAGDIFAATLFVALQQKRYGDDVIGACRFANCIAAQSVTRRNLAGLPTASDIQLCKDRA
jgi:sugar/nucleoside kinase (ribokinase family)